MSFKYKKKTSNDNLKSVQKMNKAIFIDFVHSKLIYLSTSLDISQSRLPFFICPYLLRYFPNEHYFIFSCFNFSLFAHFMNWSFLTRTVKKLNCAKRILNSRTSHMIVKITEFSNKSYDSINYSVLARLNIYIMCS